MVVDGVAVKTCMTPLKAGMQIRSGLPSPSQDLQLPAAVLPSSAVGEPKLVDVLIVGGGPAGLNAALELGKAGVQVLLVDDKDQLGGKLVLQHHKFFGTKADTRAATRGFVIAEQMAEELKQYPNVKVLLQSTAVGVFSDKVIGVHCLTAPQTDGSTKAEYQLYRPSRLLVATGAREKMLPFRGNTLPGVVGAGAFQTIVNRDWVIPARKLLIVGGGNVGLITGYHAIQAGLEVVALIEAMDSCKGYKVHQDKLLRLGVPILTSHTILAAHGTDHVTGATVAQCDQNFRPLPGTEKHLDVDCVLVAVGLSKVDEFASKAKEFGIPTFLAGDAQEIAEASAAMVTGKIAGVQIAQSLDKVVEGR